MKKPYKRFSMGKNIASNNPMVKRQKKVQKELNALIRDGGYDGLFAVNLVTTGKIQARLKLRKERIVQQALEFGMRVPQALRDEVNPPPEPNPHTNYVDDGKAPF